MLGSGGSSSFSLSGGSGQRPSQATHAHPHQVHHPSAIRGQLASRAACQQPQNTTMGRFYTLHTCKAFIP